MKILNIAYINKSLFWLAMAAISMAPQTARADVMVTNGGFESGFAGWVRVDQLGSEGTFYQQSGTTSPVNGDSVPAPQGNFAAMTDAQGPGTHVLYQDIFIPTSPPLAAATLSFHLFIGNRATNFFTPTSGSLDFSTNALNQQFRADILREGADPFSTSPADVLQNLYQTRSGDPLVSGYHPINVDIRATLAASAGTTVRLRFAEVDNVNIQQVGVDEVRLFAANVPEPSTLALIACGSLLPLLRRRRQR